VNVISWSGHASLFTFPKHTRKKRASRRRLGNVHYRQTLVYELAIKTGEGPT
jgi:hypothetical protein